jgi:DNA-binding NarL/FixJ family response regulator
MDKIKTFIVESSPVFREGLISALEEMTSVRVIGWADDEASASTWLRSHGHECDLMVTDVALRRGSGMALLQLASALPWQMSSVVLSNYTSPDVRRRCAELGAQRVFDKSDEIDALLSHCAGLASRSDAADGAPRSE